MNVNDRQPPCDRLIPWGRCYGAPRVPTTDECHSPRHVLPVPNRRIHARVDVMMQAAARVAMKSAHHLRYPPSPRLLHAGTGHDACQTARMRQATKPRPFDICNLAAKREPRSRIAGEPPGFRSLKPHGRWWTAIRRRGLRLTSWPRSLCSIVATTRRPWSQAR